MKETLSPKERIVNTAVRLFNSVGIHTTGIDRIIEESGVAKKTFYNHFESKNKLIAEYYRRKDEIWFSNLTKHSSDPEKTSLENLLGIFDGLHAWFKEDDFYGCPFIRGLSDFGGELGDDELKTCVGRHFEKTQDLVTTLLKKVRPKDFKEFVPKIMSLIAGATVVAHATKNPKIAVTNKEVARVLLSNS